MTRDRRGQCDLKLKPRHDGYGSVVTDRRRDVLAIPNAALRVRSLRARGEASALRRAAPGAGGDQAPGGVANAARAATVGNWKQRRDAAGDDAAPAVVKRTVYVLVDDKPAPREITTGITDGRLTEITGGTLKEGENVIVSVTGQNPGQQRSGQGQRAGGGLRIL
jgi:HlyD family secretion protein